VTALRPDSAVVADLERLARTELSMGARLGHVALGLVSCAMTIVVVSLWLTEPALPTRTVAAFALLAGMGIGWVIHSLWVLSVRRVLLARQRLVAGRMAVAFAGTFTAGCVLLGATSTVAAAWPASAMGLVLLCGAIALWWRAHAAHARLLARRDALEREMAGAR
jgi:hypothetical protein